LLLAVVAGFVGSVTFEDQMHADLRWTKAQFKFENDTSSATPQYNDLYKRDTRLWPNWLFPLQERAPPSLKYQQGMIYAFILIAGSLCVAFYTYVDGVGTNFEPFPKIEGEDNPKNDVIRNSWWRFAKWNLMLIFAGIFVGTLFLFDGTGALMDIKFRVYPQCMSQYNAYSKATGIYYTQWCPLENRPAAFGMLITLFVGGTVLFTGLATANRYRVYRLHRQQDAPCPCDAPEPRAPTCTPVS
jgi:hypothetical protein